MNRYPEYKIIQYKIMMDVLRGFSRDVEQNRDKSETIMLQIQKAILTSSLHK